MGDNGRHNQYAAVHACTKAEKRAKVMHPTGLTPNLLKWFEPRPMLEYKPPLEKRRCPPHTGIAQFVHNFAKPGDAEYAPSLHRHETPAERKARIHEARIQEGAKKVAEELEKYDPNNDPKISGDAFKTLFVSRLSYETTERRLKREFEAYGAIKRVRLVMDESTKKPRGYAFIEYVHMRDMHAAYKQANGKMIDNRRVVVDVERGRTVSNWRPRRLGGGIGTTRVGGEEFNHRLGLGPRASNDQEQERERSRERVRDRERKRERSQECRKVRHTKDREMNRERDNGRYCGHYHGRERGPDRERNRGRERDRNRD